MMAEGKLSEEQIFECLKSLNVPVKMNELKSPNREFMIRILECFLKDLQIDLASPVLRPWEATKHIESGDIYEEGQLMSLLAISVNHITSYVGLNITVKDIIEPKPKRTKKILNYLLVFWNYYLQMYARFNAVEETFESERKKREDLIQENESLEEKIADKLNILQNMKPSKEELQRIYDGKAEKTTKLQKESETLQAEYSELKTKEFTLKEQISAAQLNTVKAKETLDELSQLILSSPKQKLINNEIKALEEKIKDIDAKTKECESAHKDEIKKLQFLEEYQKREEQVKNSLDEIRESDKELGETVKAMVDVHQQVNDGEDKLKRLILDLERKEDLLLQQKQKSAKVLLNHKKQLEALQDHLRMSQNEEIQIKKQLHLTKNAIQEIQKNIDSESDFVLDVIKRCKEADAKSKERDVQFKSTLRKISDSFKSDCAEVIDQMKNVFPFELED